MRRRKRRRRLREENEVQEMSVEKLRQRAHGHKSGVQLDVKSTRIKWNL